MACLTTPKRTRSRLAGLTDDEYFWEPVPGCCTIRRTESGEGDQLAGSLAAAAGDLVLDDPHPRRLGRVEALAGRRARGFTSTEAYEPSGSSSSTGRRRPDFTRHSSAAPVAVAACQSGQF